MLATAIWGGAQWSGKHICFRCDNDAVVTIIQNRRSQQALLTQLLRCLFFYTAIFQFHFSASHIPGANNIVTDAISHNNLQLLYSLIPQASQVSIPPEVSRFLLSQPEWGSTNWTTQFVHSLPTASLNLLQRPTGPESTAT